MLEKRGGWVSFSGPTLALRFEGGESFLPEGGSSGEKIKERRKRPPPMEGNLCCLLKKHPEGEGRAHCRHLERGRGKKGKFAQNIRGNTQNYG